MCCDSGTECTDAKMTELYCATTGGAKCGYLSSGIGGKVGNVPAGLDSGCTFTAETLR